MQNQSKQFEKSLTPLSIAFSLSLFFWLCFFLAPRIWSVNTPLKVLIRKSVFPHILEPGKVKLVQIKPLSVCVFFSRNPSANSKRIA